MANGKKGDHPLTDITYCRIRRFSERAGGKQELERTFNLFKPPPTEEFEHALAGIRDRLYKEAKERGWEV